ncbi:hypothetical protein PIB30_086496 [Stylosanthes scabra]|uniref:Uncharacterized protein n=1 Tax=Stylosanthes scabra TaxID=79078 RepID=A0ABU6TSR5_9FABA|nr:hypothetical protein [Stylosanthes scabra]
MAEERVVTSSMSSDDSATTDRTQPSPSRVTSTSTPPNNPTSTPFQGNVSSWVLTQPLVPTSTNMWIPPHVVSQGAWPEFGLPLNYTPPIEPSQRGQGGFAVRNNPVYTNPSPSTQYIPQGWYPPPPQGGNYGYSNNPQPSFGTYGAGGTPPNFGTYNPPTMHGGPQSSSSNPVSSPALQPTQAAMTPP